MKRYMPAVMVVAIVAAASLLTGNTLIEDAFEDISFDLHPSAQRAFELGNAHFRAADPKRYDVARAGAFYRKAIDLDPNHPMAKQQLARVEFVTGRNAEALALINEQLIQHPDSNAAAHYIRALILGYLKQYDESETEYEQYIAMNPELWAAYNDLAWTRMQTGNASGALDAATQGLAIAPENPWLLTMRATALYQLGRYDEALQSAEAAVPAAQRVTQDQWIAMYPGNDPATIPQGIEALKAAAQTNLQKIRAAAASTTANRS